ncbi:MAG: stage II sporulation protein M [Candidatus Aenigmarchaeota archaeon]|nr:stage II sporulation protein M [Candidatus Aenigmarchaeota archaeon]
MVLESILPVKKVIRNPVEMLIFSMIVTFSSLYLAELIFPGTSSGKIVTLFITVGMTPMIYGLFKEEEKVERDCAEHKNHKSFFDRHDEIIWSFSFLFLGVFLAIFTVAVLAPEAYVTAMFDDQLSEIERVTSISGNFNVSSILNIIIVNNLRVMVLSFVLSFLLGSGAVVILAWNASILGLYLASFVRDGLMEEFVFRTVGLIPHAPVEILAYFLAGIAGGIISVGMIREKLNSCEFRLIFKDAIILMCLAVAAVLIGGVIEVL